jgi:hypothetical protein
MGEPSNGYVRSPEPTRKSAEGFWFKWGRVIFANQVEGWALIERKPLDGEYTSQVSEDA